MKKRSRSNSDSDNENPSKVPRKDDFESELAFLGGDFMGGAEEIVMDEIGAADDSQLEFLRSEDGVKMYVHTLTGKIIVRHDEEEEEGEGSEERDDKDDEEDLAVLSIHCGGCNYVLSNRGAETFLKANEDVEIFTSDYVTCFVEERGENKKAQYCDCKIIDICCKNCKKDVGYHVIGECTQCQKGSKNNHDWIFQQDPVKIEVRKSDAGNTITWSLIGLFTNSDILYENVDLLLLCPNCSNLLGDAEILTCGHSFCSYCVKKSIKLTCPLCKTKKLEHNIPNLIVQSIAENQKVRCKYGIKKDPSRQGVWIKDDKGCNEMIFLKDKKKHEKECKWAKSDENK